MVTAKPQLYWDEVDRRFFDEQIMLLKLLHYVVGITSLCCWIYFYSEFHIMKNQSLNNLATALNLNFSYLHVMFHIKTINFLNNFFSFSS